MSDIRLLAGSSHPKLAALISSHLETTPSHVDLGQHSNKEIRVHIKDSIREKDVFIVQTGCGKINDMLMEMLIMSNACALASARRVTCVVPCFPYARQDKSEKKTTSISAKLVASLITASDARRVITMDLHSPQIQGFFSCPVDNLSAEPAMAEWIKTNVPRWNDCVIVSPDVGGMKRVTSLAERLNLPFAVIHKERKVANEVASMLLVGDVRDSPAVLVDDMADTCGTICLAASKLKEAGAAEIYAIVTHGVLTGKALERLNNSCFEAVVVTNTIPQEDNVAKCPKLKVMDVSPMFAAAIKGTNQGTSISHLF